MIHVLYNGEQMFVHSTDGMTGCTVLDDSAAEPSPVSELARREGMSKADLFDEAVAVARAQVIDELAANSIITADVASSMKAGSS